MSTSTRSAPLLEVQDLRTEFAVRGGLLPGSKDTVKAVRGVSLHLERGETLALVGESGCGKSTLAKTVMGFHRPTSGSVKLHGKEITDAGASDLRQVRRGMQFVFQDPYSSLTPHRTIGRLIEEPLRIHGIGTKQQRYERVNELLELVGLNAEQRSRYPHEFSGGQRQRVGIARALALEPELLILDEPVSALDVSIQAQVINLLRDLQERLEVAYLFIAHDLAVVRNLSHRVAVMYLGRVVETGTTDLVLGKPTHPYTQALLSAVPIADPSARGTSRRRILAGEVPSVVNPPSGCGFRTRCWKAEERCASEEPLLEVRSAGHAPSACHFPLDPDEEATPAIGEHASGSTS